MYQFFIGIDISKNNFVAVLHGQNKSFSYPNDSIGFAAFCSDHRNALKNGLVILETTGGYESALIGHLQSQNYSVHRANARKVKHFIRSFGKLAKSDSIDAQGLAQYGFERYQTLELYKANPREKLLKLVQRRIELKQLLVQEKNRRQAPGQEELKNSFNVVIKVLEVEVTSIENKINEIFKFDIQLNEMKNIIKGIAGIGDVIAAELIALLPELGTINRKKIASLAGLAPHPNESGKKIGYRCTRGGRSEIKPILFMAAMSAARSKSSLSSFYKRLVEAGKKKMVALMALMRKIVVIANAKLRDFFALNEIPQHG